jgi:uncharacterized protein YbcI
MAAGRGSDDDAVGAVHAAFRLVSTSIRSDRPNREEILTAISDGVVRVHSLHAGAAPAGARVAWDDDWVVCMLEGALTEPERTLVAAGRFDRVRADRQALRVALEPTLRALVETLTGRPVRAYLSEVSTDGGCFEAFVLAP